MFHELQIFCSLVPFWMLLHFCMLLKPTVLLKCSCPHYSIYGIWSVTSRVLWLDLSLFFVWNQCWRDNSLTPLSSTYYALDMIHLWTLSSSYFQLYISAPIWILKCLIPPNPFMIILQSISPPIKYDGSCDIHSILSIHCQSQLGLNICAIEE